MEKIVEVPQVQVHAAPQVENIVGPQVQVGAAPQVPRPSRSFQQVGKIVEVPQVEKIVGVPQVEKIVEVPQVQVPAPSHCSFDAQAALALTGAAREGHESRRWRQATS